LKNAVSLIAPIEFYMDEQTKYIIIGRASCPFCIMAADYCIANEAQYQFLDYESNAYILEDYKLFYQQPTVPIILANNLKTGIVTKVGGYTDLLGRSPR
jgi:glutaredoxin